MGPPKDGTLPRSHSLFIDDLKTYQETRKSSQAVNETIVRASTDNGAVYGINKCAVMEME